MINTTINIKNRLEVKAGNIVLIPGCEPISDVSSLGLQRNIHCKASVIPVKDVLRLIPGSKLILLAMRPAGTLNPGSYIELPSGPPQDGNTCPAPCLQDWYQILKDNVPQPEEEKKPPCAGFNYSGCVLDQDIYHQTRDPNARPNSMPLSGMDP